MHSFARLPFTTLDHTTAARRYSATVSERFRGEPPKVMPGSGCAPERLPLAAKLVTPPDVTPRLPEAPDGWRKHPAPVHPDTIRGLADDFWVEQRHDSDKGLVIRLRFERDAAGSASCTGLLFLRSDGRALAVRDLRLPVGQIMDRAIADALVPWLGGNLGQPLVRPAHDGPRGYGTDQHERVLTIRAEAKVRAPKRHVVWMREQWHERYGRHVSDPTMRRWIQQAQQWDRPGPPEARTRLRGATVNGERQRSIRRLRR